jgi:hypothetical protein
VIRDGWEDYDNPVAISFLLDERDRLKEELRLREDSQIPAVPYGAQRQIDILRQRTAELERAILYLAGFDVAGWEPHMSIEKVLAKTGVFPEET